jgi:hypothetical protein
MIHHHGSPICTRTLVPAALSSAANALAALRSQAMAAALAGDSSADGGFHPVRAGSPLLARCCHASGQCWASNS